MSRAMWTALMHPAHGWLARHPLATLFLLFSLVTTTEGVLTWMF